MTVLMPTHGLGTRPNSHQANPNKQEVHMNMKQPNCPYGENDVLKRLMFTRLGDLVSVRLAQDFQLFRRGQSRGKSSKEKNDF